MPKGPKRDKDRQSAGVQRSQPTGAKGGKGGKGTWLGNDDADTTKPPIDKNDPIGADYPEGSE